MIIELSLFEYMQRLPNEVRPEVVEEVPDTNNLFGINPLQYKQWVEYKPSYKSWKREWIGQWRS